jgi:hypothetical protein
MCISRFEFGEEVEKMSKKMWRDFLCDFLLSYKYKT